MVLGPLRVVNVPNQLHVPNIGPLMAMNVPNQLHGHNIYPHVPNNGYSGYYTTSYPMPQPQPPPPPHTQFQTYPTPSQPPAATTSDDLPLSLLTSPPVAPTFTNTRRRTLTASTPGQGPIGHDDPGEGPSGYALTPVRREGTSPTLMMNGEERRVGEELDDEVLSPTSRV